MAKERMVTRTIELNKFTVLTVNTDTAEVLRVDYTTGALSGADPLKAIKAQHETETYKLVSIVSHEYTTVLYGMPESDFIAHATPLPPRTAQKAGETL